MAHESNTPEIDRDDVVHWAEFACWTALALMPFLQWVNGPSVSTDQAVVRTALVVLAVTGCVVLRIVNWRRRVRRRAAKTKETKDGHLLK